MSKIYTRTGDDGTTALFGFGRVPKDHPRVVAFGTVDEVNAALGLARALLQNHPEATYLSSIIQERQSELFILGADLATPTEETSYPVPRIQARHTEALEKLIDELESTLPPLKQFILPGGDPGAAQLHICRTICRRAERMVVEARRKEPTIHTETIRYLNRLSDFLFVLARWVNHRAGISDTPWHPPT